MTLAAHHRAMLYTASAIAEDIIRQRGYISFDHPAEVEALGFPAWQAKTAPALGIPLWNVHGEQSTWQLRPDNARLTKGKKPKLVKYETMADSRLQLDVHPRVQPLLGDPRVPLWVTEGVKKGDALVSAGACAIALMGGVWGFLGTNEHGGKGVILTDWQSVALNGRTVIVAYDSDLATNVQVEKALQALCAFLRSRQAIPTRVHWPEAYQQKKWGVDDFLADNKTLDDLLAMVPPSGALQQTAAPSPNGTAPPQQGGQGPPTDPNEFLTDHYNARALVDASGTVLRYCAPWKCWLIWTGTHWERDTKGEILRYALQAVKGLGSRMVGMDKDEIKALLAHIKSSLATNRLKAMLEQAQVGKDIPVLPEELDRHPWLLNCTNGTVDLKTGKMVPRDPTHLLTKCLDVPYEKDADCSEWKTFLWRIMDHNQEVIDFLQRAIGYALTGVIREHALIIFWGGGRNGKSTLLGTVLAMLGPYAMKATSELLMVGAHDRHPTERAELFQKRFVAAIETEQGRRLAEVFVKEVTGGDPITARRMREDFWTFLPTHKVFLATNHKPIIRGKDNAIWARLKLVEFGVTIPSTERDTELPDKLQAELPGILAWAVRGCLKWQKSGLGEPGTVTKSTKEWRTASDTIGAFIHARCLTGASSYTIRSSDLYEAYTTWCAETNKAPVTQQAWGADLIERGHERYTNNGTWYRGIALKDGTTGGSVKSGSAQGGSVDLGK